MKLFWHLTLNKHKAVLMLNWIVWNRTVYLYKMDFELFKPQSLICHKTKPKQTKPINFYT